MRPDRTDHHGFTLHTRFLPAPQDPVAEHPLLPSWRGPVSCIQGRLHYIRVPFTRVFKIKHQAVGQGVRRFGKRSLFER
jgi:hypothetical protein